MSDWLPIETLPDTGEQVRIRFSGGSECRAPARPMPELSRHERVKMAKDGHWPDYKNWTPTGWKPLSDNDA